MFADHPVSCKSFANVLSIGLNLSNDFLSYCESLPFTRLNFGQTPILLVALYCVSIISVLMVWERRISKGMVFIFAGIFLFISTGHYVYPYFRESGSVTFLDVGRGCNINSPPV